MSCDSYPCTHILSPILPYLYRYNAAPKLPYQQSEVVSHFTGPYRSEEKFVYFNGKEPQCYTGGKSQEDREREAQIA